MKDRRTLSSRDLMMTWTLMKRRVMTMKRDAMGRSADSTMDCMTDTTDCQADTTDCQADSTAGLTTSKCSVRLFTMQTMNETWP